MTRLEACERLQAIATGIPKERSILDVSALRFAAGDMVLLHTVAELLRRRVTDREFQDAEDDTRARAT